MLPLSYPKFYVFRSISSLLLLFHWSLLSLLQTILFKVALKYTFGEGNGTPLQYSFLEKSHGWRSLVGCSPWGYKQLDTTERLHFHFSLSCIGEGNGNPLQCSCLENPGTAGPGGLPSMGSHWVGHDWSDLAATAAEYTLILTDLYLFYHYSSSKLI